MDLKGFLTEYGNLLIEQIQQIKPLYEGKTDAAAFAPLLRQPYAKQRDAVGALVKGFQEGRNALFLTAEMGSGKTMMAVCTAYLALPERSRTIVLCPSHLVSKWIREIEATIPGAKVFDIGDWPLRSVLELRHKPCLGREFYILGKEKAKLSYLKRQECLWIQEHLKRALCPRCGADVDGQSRKHKHVCAQCGEIFWQADGSRCRRMAVAETIKRYFPKGFFDLFIADEVHQYKSGDTAQGNAFAYLAQRSRRTLCLTGTLMGGYASNMFFLLWRLAPSKMRELLGKENTLAAKEKIFIERYGVVESVMKRNSNDDALGVASIARRSRSNSRTVQKERPGISPLIFTDLLLERSVFLRLQDIAAGLPPYEDYVVSVPMDGVQADAYKRFEEDLTSAVRLALATGSTRLLGAMLQSLLAYPDGARRGETVSDPRDGSFVAEAPPLDIAPLPKEEKLLEIVRSEVQSGRKCLVYLEHTGTRDLIPDIENTLRLNGFRVAVLRSSTVKASEREAWIENALSANGGIDVLICNPRLVETGLDLIAFPTVIFFQTGYSVFTLRQAGRRSWRIGQQQPVRVYYLVYEGTLQEKALALMATKMQVALMVEGDLSDGGLTALSEGESSMMVELAKTLVENSQLSMHDEWVRLKRTQLAMNACVTGRAQIMETTTVKITDGENVETVHFTEVLRGYVYAAKDHAVAVVDNRHRFVFRRGGVYYGNVKIGHYDRSGRGQINGKPIRLVYDQPKKRWLLYELKAAA